MICTSMRSAFSFELQGSELQGCLAFVVPNHNITLLRLEHSGSDAWQPEWIRVIFDDGIFLECQDGEVIDDNEVHELTNCERAAGVEDGVL